MPDSENIEDILREEGVLKNDSILDKDLSLDKEPIVVEPISTDSECKHCGTKTRRACPTCHGAFCELCASILDPTYCKICLDEPSAQLTSSPLKDADGETHQGRDIHVSGPAFGTLCKRISDMSTYELESHIDYYKDLVRQAEKSLDFRRVVLGASQIEHAQRKDAERRKLRGIKVPHVNKVLTNAAGEILTSPPPKVKRDPVKDLAAVMGLSPDAMSKVLGVILGTPKTNKKQ